MGSCCTTDSFTVPDLVAKSTEDVFLPRPIRYATFNPENQIAHDVTQQVRNLWSQGQNFLGGGIASVLGEPFPGKQSIFKVWFLPEKPDVEWPDPDDDSGDLELKGIVCFASYSPVGAPPHDVTAAVLELQKKGRNTFHGKMSKYIESAFPGQKLVFCCWYNS